MLECANGQYKCKHTGRGHVFAGTNRLESNEWNLHREKQSQNVECCVAGEQTWRVTAHDQQHKHMQWDQIDDEDVTTPGGHHVEVG